MNDHMSFECLRMSEPGAEMHCRTGLSTRAEVIASSVQSKTDQHFDLSRKIGNTAEPD